jgi:tRNA-dihydrouridine synthase B
MTALTPRITAKTLTLGNVKIASPVVQAALSGYSDWPMRVIARRLGSPYSLCEVMLDQFLVALKNRQRTGHFLHNTEEEKPVGGQLMGAEPEQFSAGALKLVEAGFDVIDINFGCPVKKVLGRCRGGFHLSQPEVALEIVARTRDVVPPEIPVTVKMRRGIDDTQESRDNFFEILDGAFALGVSGITVHGRTVKQRYIGPSRWSFLKEVKTHVGDKVILGSGDLFTAADCVRMLAETGVDGVTVARGAIGNPWIFSQAQALLDGKPLPPPPTVFEQKAIIKEHWKLAEQIYAENRCGILMRKFGIKYAQLHPQPLAVREAFVKVRCWDDWFAALEKWYAEDAPGNYPAVEGQQAESECG